jgi:hypothetical protein
MNVSGFCGGAIAELLCEYMILIVISDHALNEPGVAP